MVNPAPISGWTLEDCKARQKVVRSRITNCHSRINHIVRGHFSRRDAEKLLAEARVFLGELEEIHNRFILLIEDQDAISPQTALHLIYASVIDDSSALIENYLLLRQDDASSVVVESAEETARRQALATAEQRLRDARAELSATEQEVIDLGGEVTITDSSELNPSDSVSQIGRRTDPSPVASAVAPDAWIDLYVAGREKPHVRGKGNKSFVTIQLEVYSGQALDWFAWISMWHALVHTTSKTASEKLAILKNYLKGDLADIVYGHGGGESGYKEALQRLKKTGHTDIIERLTRKLPLTDRFAWNEGRGADLERRTINEFGRWLTARAVTYQNAYAIAEDQQLPGSGNQKNNHQPSHQSQPRPSQQQKRNVRAHHRASSTHNQKEPGSTEQKEKKNAELYCFKCEGPHRLEDCIFFKNLPISDRLTFVQRRGLCYGCFGLTYHRLLHKEKTPAEKTARTHTLRADRRQIAFKVIRVDALDVNGEAVPVNVLMDDGSDSTLIREGLARRLQLAGQQQTLVVNGVGEESSTHLTSEYLELRLKTSSEEIVSIQGSTIPSITKPVAVMEWEKLHGRWSHLADLPPLRTCGGRVDVLIGLDHAALITAIESRFGKDDEPTASKTRLGWTLQGAVEGSDGSSIARVHHVITDADINLQLVEQVRRFCDTESFGTEFKADCMSAANQKAVTKLESETEKLSVGYAAPVLWIDDDPPEIPDSRHTAEMRLKSLLNKFTRGPADYENFYRAAMEKNFTEGYARRLSSEEIQQKPSKYFLPHFGVPKWPGDLSCGLSLMQPPSHMENA
ncbi:uncharacterized protein LOC123472631 [Daphnia magna]|uniref:uncharacterized protein LOC123472631 n=1 Tax=Daphnia magna TaxID=35525 RepID=UPI001E1BB4EB|nr:uncharacterized protein LOC123472631 [Daphnia magna]